jgi:hypothetical protein
MKLFTYFKNASGLVKLVKEKLIENNLFVVYTIKYFVKETRQGKLLVCAGLQALYYTDETFTARFNVIHTINLNLSIYRSVTIPKNNISNYI